MRRGTISWIRRAAAIVAAAYVSYLAAGNVFLGTDVGRTLLNRKPDRLQVAWRSAHTWWPGRVHVERLELKGRSRRADWEARLDEATFSCSVPALVLKRFTVGGLEGSGLTYRMRWLSAPRSGRKEPKPRPWRIRLQDVSVEDVREVVVNDQALTGDGTLSGGADFTIRGPFELSRSRLRFEHATLASGDETISEDLRLETEIRFTRYVPREHRGREHFRFLSGRIAFDSPRSRFDVLDRYFERADWVGFGGSGRVHVDLPIEAGRLVAGGEILVQDAKLTLDALEFEAHGTGHAGLRLLADGSRLESRLDSFDLRPNPVGEDTAVLVRGDDLRFLAEGGRIDLAGDPPHLDLHLAIAVSEIPDLDAYNRFLPSKGDLSIRSGKGELEGELSMRTDEDSAAGLFEIRTEGLALGFGELEAAGRARFTLRVADAALRERRFDVAGTDLELTGFRVTSEHVRNAEDWWATVLLTEAEIVGRDPVSLSADFAAEMKNSRPIVGFLAEEKPLIGWIDGLLTAADVSASGTIGMSPHAWAMDDVRVEGKKLEILAHRLRLAEGAREGLIFFSRGPLSAAVKLEGGERDWKLLHSRRWFEEQRGTGGT